jgi:FAD/FMN-containing dehydrogenase
MNENSAVLSWGRVHRFRQEHLAPATLAEAATLWQKGANILPIGCRRSYGDSCLNEGSQLLDTRKLDYFAAFDRESGILTCEPGVTLADILWLCRTPNKDGSHWFPPVSPGTKSVTVGGAIANDVHGKNHHMRGTIGNHVLGFELYRSDGSMLLCSPSNNVAFFQATIGGLGLTGLIGRIKLQMMRVDGLQLDLEDIAISDLDQFFALSEESASGWEYSVAWIDCLARGGEIGRGIFSRAHHRHRKNASLPPPGRAISIPYACPVSPLNTYTLKSFNALYRRRLWGQKRRQKSCYYESFLFPLDAIGNWNRLYGKSGFYQYQCVLPPGSAREAVREQLALISELGEGSFLAVLKVFGDRKSPGLLSFPMPGATLALDFPNRGQRTLALLDRLDAITLSAGGRLYPAKDGRMAAATFQAIYPGWKEFAHYLDPAASSSFWRRVTSV